MLEFPNSYTEKGECDFIRRKGGPEIPTRLFKWKYVSREVRVGLDRFQMPPNYNPIVIPYTQSLNFKVYFLCVI